MCRQDLVVVDKKTIRVLEQTSGVQRDPGPYYVASQQHWHMTALFRRPVKSLKNIKVTCFKEKIN